MAIDLNPKAITADPNQIFDPTSERGITVGHNFSGKVRWHIPSAATIIDVSDSPVDSPTAYLYTPGSGKTQWGKYFYRREAKLRIGSTLRVSAWVKAQGTIDLYTLNVRAFDAAHNPLGSIASVAFTSSATPTEYVTPRLPIVATTDHFIVWIQALSTANPLIVYNMQYTKGSYTPGLLVSESAEAFEQSRPQGNVHFDPYNRNPHKFMRNWNGLLRWVGSGEIVYNDPKNPYKSNSYRSPAGGQLGIKLHRREIGFKTGQWVTCTIHYGARVTSGTGGVIVRARFRTADGSATTDGSPITDSDSFGIATVTADPIENIATVRIKAPADGDQLWFWIQQSSGTPIIDVYGSWITLGDVSGPIATPSIAPTHALRNAVESEMNLALFNRGAMMNWMSKRAWITARQSTWKGTWTDSTTKVQAHIACGLDSWTQRRNFIAPFRILMQGLYGDAGIGLVSAYSDHAAANWRDRYAWSRTGTWTEVDGSASALALGVDISHVSTTDTSATYTITENSGAISNNIKVFYVKKSGGGTFQVRIDGGSWSSDISTDDAVQAAAVHQVAGVPGTAAAHTFELKITGAGSAGVILTGFKFVNTSVDGVVIDKIGNGSSTAANWAAVDATIWQQNFALLGSDVFFTLVGTNDKTQEIVPDTHATSLDTLLTRARTAIPTVDIVIASPADTGDTKTYEMEMYDQVQRHLALQKDYAHLSFWRLMHPYSRNKALHIMNPDTGSADAITGAAADNGRHWQDIGGQMAANIAMQMFRAE